MWENPNGTSDIQWTQVDSRMTLATAKVLGGAVSAPASAGAVEGRPGTGSGAQRSSPVGIERSGLLVDPVEEVEVHLARGDRDAVCLVGILAEQRDSVLLADLGFGVGGVLGRVGAICYLGVSRDSG